MKDVMLDLETLSLSPRAVVVSIGAVYFDPASDHLGAPFSLRLGNLREQTERGRDIDPDTITWWMSQSPEAQRQTFLEGTQVNTAAALSSFADYIGREGKDVRVWGNGAAFDNVVMKSLYKDFGIPLPWSYKNDRCFRTLASLTTAVTVPHAGVPHKALDDAITQARHAQCVFMRLKYANLGSAVA